MAPHIFGFSSVAPCITLTSVLASARLVWSVSALINEATLDLVGLVLLSAFDPAFRLSQDYRKAGKVPADRFAKDFVTRQSCPAPD
jgi:hypothetical protein